jgi:cytochrome c-type biogenesis protein CcmH/NrfG
MHLGVALAILNRFDKSLVQLRRAVADNPDHALSWINLGATLAAAGHTDEAIQAYSEAIRLQPDSQEARHRRALLR